MTLNYEFIESKPDYEFKVLAINGNIEYKCASDKKWKKLKIGSELNKKDMIRIDKNSYLGLVHRTGKTKEIRVVRFVIRNSVEEEIYNLNKEFDNKEK